MIEQQLGAWEQQPNVGYVAQLKLLPIESVLDLTTPERLPVAGRPLTVATTGLALADNTVVTELRFPSKGCVFNETQQREGGLVRYALSLDLAIPKNNEALQQWLYNQQERRWLAVWTDWQGVNYVGGDPGAGLWLTAGRQLAGPDLVSLALRGMSYHPAWYLESLPSAISAPDNQFDVSFDYSFTA